MTSYLLSQFRPPKDHVLAVRPPSAHRKLRWRSRRGYFGKGLPACSLTMYSAYQSGQFTSCPPVSSSCSPCAAAARRSVAARVLIDGMPPGEAHGVDVDKQGNGTVTEQRLYQLVRQPEPVIERQFEIEFLDRGVEAFAFTFG